MPYKSEKIKIAGGQYDRRVKLTAEEKAEIHRNELGLSQRALARKYGVSRRTITFILDPAKMEQNYERRKERGGSKQYYERKRHTEAIRKHRRYKQKLKLQGKIGEEAPNSKNR